jgi:type I restriction enzyme, S subunit
MSGLPVNWESSTLETLGQWGSGGTPKRTNSAYYEGGTIPWLIIGDLNDSVVTHTATRITEAGLVNSSAKLLPPNTLLVAMYGSIGKLGITGVECATNQAIAFCKPTQDVASLRYLFYVLMNAKDELIALGQGGAQQNISQGILKAHVVPLAPLNEQNRIAKKLDAVLARVNTCLDRLDRIPSILKRFRQSVVSAATNGLLTSDWRMSNYGSSDWEITTTTLVEQCIQDRVITYGVIKLGDETSQGVPCLRTSNVRWLRIDIDGIKKISQELSNKYPRTILQGGEVLVNVRGTLGGVAVATKEMIGWNVSREVAVVPVDQSKVNPQFLALWIGAERSQAWLRGVEKGVAYTGINIEDLRTLPLEFPKLEEQAEIVRRFESLITFADRIDSRYQSARAQCKKLTPALLSKAFRGELVPQDPNDEPASVLLERIRATSLVKEKQTKIPRKAHMEKHNTETVKAIIQQMPLKRFSFDELRSRVTTDYESLKDIVFALLSESEPLLRQVFDEKAQAMCLEKVGR